MRLNFVKISPAQNMTVLITDYVDPARYLEIARVVMSYEYLNAEQVGFIVPPKTNQSRLGLEMSGGEFCGNAVLCAAAFGLYKGICQEGSFMVESSGAKAPLLCQAKAKSRNVFEIKAEMPQPFNMEELEIDIEGRSIFGWMVQLSGISHFVTNFWPSRENFEQMVESLQGKVDARALGIIPYRKLGEGKYEIWPYVCVRDTGSRVFEQACGTGSLSLGAHLHALQGECTLQVLQPGGIITVETGAKNFITTDVFFTCEGSVIIEENEGSQGNNINMQK